MGRVKEWALFGADEASIDLHDAARRLGGCVRDGKVVTPSMVVTISPSGFFIYDCRGSIAAARRLVAKKLGIVEASGRDKSDLAIQIWHETVPAAGTLVERYLRSRAIDLPVPEALRFHPQLFHTRTRTAWPAMVAAVVTSTGGFSAVHRTWLRPDGSGKAPVDPPRMSLGPIGGNSVHLAAVTEDLVVGEGIETCLSAGRPSWAALSAVGIRQLILPDAVRTVTILVDGDKWGISASLAAAGHWRSQGRRVLTARAPMGFDFNDVKMGRAL